MGVVMKTDDIIQSLLQWYGHVICGDINSQLHEVMAVEITGKRRRVDQRNNGKSA